jgi:hypothetical protein
MTEGVCSSYITTSNRRTKSDLVRWSDPKTSLDDLSVASRTISNRNRNDGDYFKITKIEVERWAGVYKYPSMAPPAAHPSAHRTDFGFDHPTYRICLIYATTSGYCNWWREKYKSQYFSIHHRSQKKKKKKKNQFISDSGVSRPGYSGKGREKFIR